jgi:hypothetical protein
VLIGLILQFMGGTHCFCVRRLAKQVPALADISKMLDGTRIPPRADKTSSLRTSVRWMFGRGARAAWSAGTVAAGPAGVGELLARPRDPRNSRPRLWNGMI